MGQSLHLDVTPHLGMINSSDGLKYVLETEVCSAITLEFMYSGFTNGAWLFEDVKRYAVDREILIDGKRIDLFVNRYKINEKKQIEYSAHPVLIEAKRVDYFTPNLKEGESRGSSNYESIKDDINKLRSVRTFVEARGKMKGYEDFDFEGAFIHAMFWGLTKNPKELRSQIISKLECSEDDFKKCIIKYFPSKWDENQNGPEVTEWGWVCLYEIDPPTPIQPIFKILEKKEL